MNSIYLSLDPSKDFYEAIQFKPKSIIIDNISSQYLYLPDVRWWVPPYFLKVVIPFYSQAVVIRTDKLPNGAIQPNPNINSPVSVYLTDQELPPSAGAFYQPASVPIGFAWDIGVWDAPVSTWS